MLVRRWRTRYKCLQLFNYFPDWSTLQDLVKGLAKVHVATSTLLLLSKPLLDSSMNPGAEWGVKRPPYQTSSICLFPCYNVRAENALKHSAWLNPTVWQIFLVFFLKPRYKMGQRQNCSGYAFTTIAFFWKWFTEINFIGGKLHIVKTHCFIL